MRSQCNVHDDDDDDVGHLGRCKRSFRSSQRSIRGGPTDRPTDVRPFDRETESARAAAAVPASQSASQPSWSPPLLSSPLLVCFAEGCQAIENVILPTHSSIAGDYEQYMYMDYPTTHASLSRSTTKGNERAPGGTTAFVDRDKHTQGQIDT